MARVVPNWCRLNGSSSGALSERLGCSSMEVKVNFLTSE